MRVEYKEIANQIKNHLQSYLNKKISRKISTFFILMLHLFIQNVFSDAGNGHDYTTLNYLTIPIVGKVKVGPIYGLAGITSGFRVGGSHNLTNGTSTKVSSDDYKGYDFGAQLGLGFQLLIFGIEGRYTWGLTDITKGGGDVNNSAFELGVHVHLF